MKQLKKEAITLMLIGGSFSLCAQPNVDVEMEWVRHAGGTGANAAARGITTDPWGNVYYTGGIRGAADFNPGTNAVHITSVGSSDIFIAKSDPSGHLIWVKQIGVTKSNEGDAIASDTAGNICCRTF